MKHKIFFFHNIKVEPFLPLEIQNYKRNAKCMHKMLHQAEVPTLGGGTKKVRIRKLLIITIMQKLWT